jgi:hypothetical protein
MIITRRAVMGAGLSLLTAASANTLARTEWGELNIGEGLEDLAVDAFIYGYPLVSMEMTRRVMTNVTKPEVSRAPMGQLIKIREYLNASYRDVIFPNADTLYTTAWIDVGTEPWVLSIPDMKDRYFMFPMLDAWTTVFQVPGTRTTGAGAQTYAVTGPKWKGTLPAGVKECKSHTNIVWILGRIYCTGTAEDYEAVHKLQDECKLMPLSAYGRPYTPPEGKVDPSIDMKTAVRDQVNRMDTTEFFSLLAQVMKNNPPSAADAPALSRFAKIGLVPGNDFDASRLNADVERHIPELALDRIKLQLKINRNVKHVNGWTYTTKTGIYGTDFLMRAFVTAFGIGANLPQDSVYPASARDADGNQYEGSNKYIIHFEKGKTPPAKGFWSITLYDSQFFFVANSIDRYSISPRQNLKTNKDGSIDIYVQKDTPGANKESNWLPAPAGNFLLFLRMYWPNEADPSILDGTWTMPSVKKAAAAWRK